jgi:hypothetical protein
MRESWDYLILLDACRYDYFEQLYHKYFMGNLSKKLSVGSSTRQWRDKSFTEFYPDVIYISSNPYINYQVRTKGFWAKEHFSKVYDLWQSEWDSKKGTVLPEAVTKRAIEIINANRNKRAIIHYSQPHEPYLGLDLSESVLHRHRPLIFGIHKKNDQKQTKPTTTDKIMKMLQGLFFRIGLKGNLAFWKLREFMNLAPANHMDAIRRIAGKEGLRKAYKQNLVLVLKQVAELLNHLTGKIVITADHGEMLGESRCYGHWGGAKKKQLLEIPWLEIDKKPSKTPPKERKADTKYKQKEPKEPAPSEKTEQAIHEEIRDRLRALGYYD